MINTNLLLKQCEFIAGIHTYSIMITPFVAKELLKANVHNRKISGLTVKKYINEMESGEWMLSPQGIGFNDKGELIDGQHRLQAIIDSNITVPILVVTGLPIRTQEKVDRQKKRSLYDVFYLAGYADNRREVQIATFLTLLRRGVTKYSDYSDSEVRECLECHRESINKIIIETKAKSGNRGFGRVGFLGACVLYYEIDRDKATDFIRKVISGSMITYDNPAMRLRRYLLEEGHLRTALGGKPLQKSDYRKTLFAINAFHINKSIVQLREAENFNFI